MQTVTSTEQIQTLTNNKIIGNFRFDDKSKIVFNGQNNILVSASPTGSEGMVKLVNTTLTINGSNNLIYLTANVKPFSLNLNLWNNSTFYCGSECYFNGKLDLQCSEQANIFIGDECLFSTNVNIHTADVHLIYDCETHKRINFAKSIYIGDHCWVGQNAMIWKGTQIGSGSIIGAGSVVAGKRIPSNESWAGNPARKIKSGVFFRGNSTHGYTDEEIEKWSVYQNDRYIYRVDDSTVKFEDIETALRKLGTAEERAAWLARFGGEQSKNRFWVGDMTQSEGYG